MSKIPEIFERAYRLIRGRLQMPTWELEAIVREDPFGVVGFGEEIINTMEHRAHIELATMRLDMDERDVRIVLDIVDIARRLCATPEKMPIEPDMDEASRLLIQQMMEEDQKAQMPKVRVKQVSKDRSGIIRAARKQLAYDAQEQEAGKTKVPEVLVGSEQMLGPKTAAPPTPLPAVGLLDGACKLYELVDGIDEMDDFPPPLSLVNEEELLTEEELSEEEQIRLAIERSLMNQ